MFLRQPVNVPLPGGKYELVTKYEYVWTHTDGHTYKLIIPAGFINDGATVHRLFWTLSGLTPDGLLRAGALIHDALLKVRGQIPANMLMKQSGILWYPAKLSLNKIQVDTLFKKVLRESGNKKWHIWLCYYAVRAYTYIRGYSW